MVSLETSIIIQAPIEHCFDAARNISLHPRTVWKHTREQAVAGVTNGFIESGQTVTFEATHFGVRQRLTSEVTAYKRPLYFTDEMQSGAFRSMTHQHYFSSIDHEYTQMKDVLIFEAPFGVLGKMAERWVLESYMKRFLEHRNEQLKQWLESGEFSKIRSMDNNYIDTGLII
ncbi:SRPBCC family protein [Paenibacillus sp. 453mf]|uniref:SRPBCC family protein n=1 Tax=Paenibacillus sp. 453mf TaxID=1761874 RepID=UPI0008EC5E2B|nr:SRPBCC family protein [Paenibacillus sp. 453mf]SFS41992.1 Ligand-binding SRPBCC domain-containing protein [Paenibacillus sp. 453mf]